MNTVVATIPDDSARDARPSPHGRVSIATRMVDGRTRPAQRRRELIRLWTDALGGKGTIAPAMRLRVERAAELTVIAELTRAAAMRGEASPDDVVRAENLAGRAERALRIPDRVKPADPIREVHAYLAGKANGGGQ